MIEIAASGIDHAEGIAWSPEGFAVCGSESGDVLAIDTSRGRVWNLASTGGNLLGIAVAPDGTCFACDVSHGMVWRIEPETRLVDALVPPCTFRVPNACVVATDGSLIVTDSGSCWAGADGSLNRIDEAGDVHVLTEPIPFANGVDVAGDEVFVVETNPPALTRYQMMDDWTIGRRIVIAALPGSVPDGVHVAWGTVYVTLYRPDSIVAVDEAGVRVVAYDPQGRFLQGPSNCCREGDGERLLIANTAGTIISAVTDSGRP